MKRRILVNFNATCLGYEQLATVLDTLNCRKGLKEKGNILGNYYESWFDSEDPRLAGLRSGLEELGIRWSERIEHTYSDTELRRFPYLFLMIEREALEHHSPFYGTEYDMSAACSRCGTGAVQTSPLRIPLTGLPKKGLLCKGPSWEVLVGESLAEALGSAALRGVELRQARFYRNDQPLPWWQLISRFEMPRMHGSTLGITTSETDHVTETGMVIRAIPPCRECRKNGRFGSRKEPLEVVYSRRDLNIDIAALPDIAHTWECFGGSRLDPEDPKLNVVAKPNLLVSPRVFDVFRRLKAKQTTFAPVRFLD